MAELKKCPFCGGEAEINYVGTCIPLYFVSCKECGCKQESSIHRDSVINAWNNRATEAEIRNKAIDEFAEKLKAIVEKDLANPDLMLMCKQCGIWKAKDIDEIAEQLKGE